MDYTFWQVTGIVGIAAIAWMVPYAFAWAVERFRK